MRAKIVELSEDITQEEFEEEFQKGESGSGSAWYPFISTSSETFEMLQARLRNVPLIGTVQAGTPVTAIQKPGSYYSASFILNW